MLLLLTLLTHSAVSNSLQHHGLQHATLPCLSPSPGACSNSYLLTGSCHPKTSFSVAPFSSCLLSFPESGSFPMSRLFTSGGQGIEALAWVLPMNLQGWIPLGLTDLSADQGTLRSLHQHHSSKVSILSHSAFFMVQLSHPYVTMEKP